MQIVALDLETTWLDSKKDKIIEIALVKFDSNTFEIIEKFETLINPLIPIPEINSNITNIFDKDVKDSPTFDEKMISKIDDFIWDAPILWHNTYFDRDFLISAWVWIEENIVLDTFSLTNIIFFEEKSLNLWALCERFNIKLENAHRAMADTLATVKIFEQAKKAFKRLSITKKELINFIFTKSSHKSFKKYIEIFDIESDIISESDFIKYIKKASGILKSEDIKMPTNPQVETNLEKIFTSFSNFEVRNNQLLMSQKFLETLFDNKKTLIEAPTWVWKTFAYLIPSIVYSLKEKEQVFISTNTKTLQDQIYFKDLEFLKNNIWYEFTYSKLKWKRNYFSIYQFLELFLTFDSLDLNETAFFSKIVLWLYNTDFWELDELNYYPKEFTLLKNINADHFLVLRDDNPYKHYEFLYKARINSQKSNIVIINHSILLQDTKSNSWVLPEVKNLVIDEAHNLEDTTTDALKKSFTIENLNDTFWRIKSTLNKNSKIIDNLDNKITNITSSLSLVFDLFSDYVIRKANNSSQVFDTLIEKDFFSRDINVQEIKNTLEITFIDIFNSLSVLDDKIYNSIKSDVSSLEEILEVLQISLDEKKSGENICVFSYNENYSNSLSYTLLNPWKFLKEKLWDKTDSVLLTSATLKISNEFNYISNILNLKDDFEMISLESDFDYSNQSLLFIPNDLGSVKYLNILISNFILEFLKIVKWNALVLFTSFASIKELYLFANVELKKVWTTLLSQSISWSKHKIIWEFKNNPEKKVILWTDSFWEWIDIPGEDLKYLIIYKFPFIVPTDPIFKARSKLFKDAFREYSIPKAIIKTKQWFWRLIRTKNDKWVVILLDDRFSNTNWWYLMRDSFPENINMKVWNSQFFLKLVKNTKL